MQKGTYAALIGLALLSGALPHPATGQAEERVIELQAFDAGHDFYFMLEGVRDKNPTLILHPGERVIVNLRNIAHVEHNVRLDTPIAKATPLIKPGKVATLHFTVPENASGSSWYWCDPHKELGMIGKVRFREFDGAAETPGIPALAVVAAGVGAIWLTPLPPGRRRP